MTRTYAALKLLEHGPLSRAEFVEITGWRLGTCRALLCRMTDAGQIKRVARRKYAL